MTAPSSEQATLTNMLLALILIWVIVLAVLGLQSTSCHGGLTGTCSVRTYVPARRP